VTDLADAIAPGVARETIGIRPGEKLHELLITADESRHAIDAGEVYVVLPEHPWWDAKGPATFSHPMPDGFVYASDTNDVWLTVPELRAMLGELVPAA
jgi:UDP-N-acetylglucosamine 4,6-dehydratase